MGNLRLFPRLNWLWALALGASLAGWGRAQVATAPTIAAPPVSVSANKDTTVVLRVIGQGNPAPLYAWTKDGVILAGQTNATLTFSPLGPTDAGIYTVTLSNPAGEVTSVPVRVAVVADIGAKSAARWWNEALLDGIRRDVPNPPVHARNLFQLSAVLWDAFWAYERGGWSMRREVYAKEEPVLPASEDARVAAQQQAMSYAAYTMIEQRFARSPGVTATTAGIRWLMEQYGYDVNFKDASGNSPAAVGLRIARKMLSVAATDGANEANGYPDATGYRAVNPPLMVRFRGVGVGVDASRWQPLDLVNTVTQNGIVLAGGTQAFVGANAKLTQTFAVARAANGFLADDPGPPPRFPSADYVKQAVEVLTMSSHLTTADGATMDISPGAVLNNPLGTNDGRGHALNPATGEKYASNVVLRGDYARVLAEYWADGPSSETPPGHWNVLFNQVSDHPLATRQWQGQSRPLRRIEWDVAGYLALNGALHDAACAAWTLKWQYDSARPITAIRYLAGLGQSSDAALPNYHANGLPLVPGLIELVTAASSAPGQRHNGLSAEIGQIVVKTWLGIPPSATQTAGVDWMPGTAWMPYQRETFVTPAFPGYVSGHSTFSRAAAEVITRLTGSEFFPGGLATQDFAAGTALGFEAGPARAVQLQWATYFDAADQAGVSRLYGGIHVAADDFTGRRVGAKVGRDAWEKFTNYYLLPATPTAAPMIAVQPVAIATSAGRTAVFTVEAGGSGPLGYEWRRGTVVVGTQSTLALSKVTVADAGDYTVTVRNSLGAATSQIARLAVDGSPVLANVSTRAAVGAGDRALIAGFVVSGSTVKQVLVRGVGPTLTTFGVGDALPNPTVTLFDGNGRKVAVNDNWNPQHTSATGFAAAGGFALADGSADAALRVALVPGNYTAVMTDATGRTGTGLLEIYEADGAADKLVNFSSRAWVDANAGVSIAGFVVRGAQPARYLIRGVGPGLAAVRMSGPLSGVVSDPALTLSTAAGVVVATNDNWGAAPNASEVAAVAARVGAFPLEGNSRDAALLVSLAPGNYTAQVRGVGGASGVALVEIYEVP